MIRLVCTTVSLVTLFTVLHLGDSLPPPSPRPRPAPAPVPSPSCPVLNPTLPLFITAAELLHNGIILFGCLVSHCQSVTLSHSHKPQHTYHTTAHVPAYTLQLDGSDACHLCVECCMSVVTVSKPEAICHGDISSRGAHGIASS